MQAEAYKKRTLSSIAGAREAMRHLPKGVFFALFSQHLLSLQPTETPVISGSYAFMSIYDSLM